MSVCLLAKMLHILVLCPVLLIAGVQTLTIDSQLGTSIEGELFCNFVLFLCNYCGLLGVPVTFIEVDEGFSGTGCLIRFYLSTYIPTHTFFFMYRPTNNNNCVILVRPFVRYFFGYKGGYDYHHQMYLYN